MKNTLILLLVTLLATGSVTAQLQSSKERKLVRDGNKLYQSGKFNDAETQYRKGLEENRSSPSSAFNLGDALYKQGKYSEALSQFENISSQKTDKKIVSDAYHNLGNALLKSEKYEESVNAFKQSLLNNPSDNDTRYNLAYAMSKLKQQQQQQDKNKDKKDNKDNKDNKDKKDQKDKDQKDKQQPNKDDKQQQDKSQAQQPKPKISKEDAERMLAALKNDEKDVQKRLQKKEAVRGRIEKNW